MSNTPAVLMSNLAMSPAVKAIDRLVTFLFKDITVGVDAAQDADSALLQWFRYLPGGALMFDATMTMTCDYVID